MEYRRIGSTELHVSEIGFGCGGNAGLMVRGSAEDQQRVVARAIDLGINYFDNAPDYGNGAAEINLGRALRALGHRPIITSKVEVRQADLGDIAGHVMRSVEASLTRLGIEALDIVQIHNGPTARPPTLLGPSYRHLWIDDYLRPGGALDGLEQVLRQGKARYAGFICRGNDGGQVRQLLDTRFFHMINVPYTLLNPTAARPRPESLAVTQDFGGVINDAYAHGVGTAVYSPLAGGVLTDAALTGGARHPLARPPDTASVSYQRNRQKAQALSFLRHHGVGSLAQAAIRFILMTQGVTVVLSGFSATSHVEEIAAVSGTAPIAPEHMTRIEAVWRDNFGIAMEVNDHVEP